jgi:type VI secretion system protein ImpH
MAGQNRDKNDRLKAMLRDSASVCDLRALLRRLEAWHAELPRLGKAALPQQTPLQLCQVASLGFAPSEVARFLPRDGQQSRDRLFVYSLGLLGPNGPMPTYLTEHIRNRERNFGDPTLARFLDLFNDRMLALFYRAWTTAQQGVSRDRPAEDAFARYVGSLIGIGTAAFRQRDAVPDDAKRFFSGHLAAVVRHPAGLREILAFDFDVPAEIEELRGIWVELPIEYRCRLGVKGGAEALGASTVVGRSVWDVHHRVRIRLGPMALATYRRLLPGGGWLERFRDWCRFYTCREWEWELQLVLRAQEVPQTQLGAGALLGWSTWMGERQDDRDADDLVLTESAA